MSSGIIDMTMPSGKKSQIIVGKTKDDLVEIWFTRDTNKVAIVLPPGIAWQLADALRDAVRSTQKVPTPAQQIEQGRRCSCGGSDEMCACQNVVPFNLAPKDST